MRPAHRKLSILLVTVAVGLFAAVSIRPIVRGGVSPVTAGIIVGVLGTLCLIGIGFGIWDARRLERRRKAKEQIWMKH